jgi:3',5'-cyclic AMP phosphodiesterase CpdA
VIVAQLSDTHVMEAGGRQWAFFDTSRALARCVAAVNARTPRPDVVLVTGDVCDRGRPAEYARARALLEGLAMPYFVIPGNHDRAEALAAAFPDRVRRSPDVGLSYVVEEYPVRLIMLDSTRAGRHGGDIDAAKAAWLEAALAAAPERPTLIALHHPPFEPRVPLLDIFPFRGAEAFGAIVARRRNVVRLASGHVHHVFERAWNGTQAWTAMSTSPQFFPRGVGRVPLFPTYERPGYLVHAFDGRSIATERAYVGSSARRSGAIEPRGAGVVDAEYRS